LFGGVAGKGCCACVLECRQDRRERVAPGAVCLVKLLVRGCCACVLVKHIAGTMSMCGTWWVVCFFMSAGVLYEARSTMDKVGGL